MSGCHIKWATQGVEEIELFQGTGRKAVLEAAGVPRRRRGACACSNACQAFSFSSGVSECSAALIVFLPILLALLALLALLVLLALGARLLVLRL